MEKPGPSPGRPGEMRATPANGAPDTPPTAKPRPTDHDRGRRVPAAPPNPGVNGENDGARAPTRPSDKGGVRSPAGKPPRAPATQKRQDPRQPPPKRHPPPSGPAPTVPATPPERRVLNAIDSLLNTWAPGTDDDAPGDATRPRDDVTKPSSGLENSSDSDDDQMSMVSASASLPDILDPTSSQPTCPLSGSREQLLSSQESFELASEATPPRTRHAVPELRAPARTPARAAPAPSDQPKQYSYPDYDLIVPDPSVPPPPGPTHPDTLLTRPDRPPVPPEMDRIPEEHTPTPSPPTTPLRNTFPTDTPPGTPDPGLKKRHSSKKKRSSRRKRPPESPLAANPDAPHPPLEPVVRQIAGRPAPLNLAPNEEDGRGGVGEGADGTPTPGTPLRPWYGLPDYDMFKEAELAHSENRTIINAIHGVEKVISEHCRVLAKKHAKSGGNERNSDQVPRTALRAERVTVYVRFVFLKIGEIDTLKEQFNADAFIQARWREPFLDGRREINPEEIDWDKYWNPKLYVENSLGEPKETIWQTLMLSREGEATVYERRRIKGSFLENLELNEFPFDTQDLTLTVSSERSESELDLVEDGRQISSINVQSFVDEQEWRLHAHVETWRRVSERVYQSSRHRHPAISASCRASRRPGFFLYNIFLVMLSICSLAFTTFTVDLELPMNRLQLSFILLLTTITFKFVVSQSLPRIPYLTYLDKYILTSMAILCTVCIWHSVVPLMKHVSVLSVTADRCALLIIWSTYAMFHICLCAYIYWGTQRKRWLYAEKDRMHKERMKQLQKQEELDAAKLAKMRSAMRTMSPPSPTGLV